MVILGRELKPGGGAGGAATGGWQPSADAHLSGAAISAAASGLDLEEQIQWYHDVLGLQLISLADGSTALLAAGGRVGGWGSWLVRVGGGDGQCATVTQSRACLQRLLKPSFDVAPPSAA